MTTNALLENQNKYPNETDFEYILVDDCSKDSTWQALCQFKSRQPDQVTLIRLLSNVGSYNAIHAGLERATGDCIVIMAADLQDPPEHIRVMYQLWKEGAKLVLANRTSRQGHWIDSLYASVYLTVLRLVGIPKLPKGGFDFCLFDQEVNEQLLNDWKWNTNSLLTLLYMPYSYALAPYQKRKRELGTSQWTMSKKLELFVNTILAFAPWVTWALYACCVLTLSICFSIGSLLTTPSILAIFVFALLLYTDLKFRSAQKHPPVRVAQVV